MENGYYNDTIHLNVKNIKRACNLFIKAVNYIN